MKTDSQNQNDFSVALQTLCPDLCFTSPLPERLRAETRSCLIFRGFLLVYDPVTLPECINTVTRE